METASVLTAQKTSTVLIIMKSSPILLNVLMGLSALEVTLTSHFVKEVSINLLSITLLLVLLSLDVSLVQKDHIAELVKFKTSVLQDIFVTLKITSQTHGTENAQS